MNRLKLFSLKPCALVFLFLICVQGLRSQDGPGLVNNRKGWVQGNDSNHVLANQWLIDLNDSNSVLETSLNSVKREYTMFFTVHPDSLPLRDTVFAQLGKLTLNSNGVFVEGRFIPVDFSDGFTKIIAIRGRSLSKVFTNRAQASYKLYNPHLFSLAEILVYDRALDSMEIKRVTSYLAIKHAVPLARGNQSFSYFLKGSCGKYWNESVSRLYNQDLLAIGNSQEELLYQSQSRTQDDSLKIGLDTLVSDGYLPNVGIADQSFIVFSKAKNRYRKYIKCQNGGQNWSPIFFWKFELQDWYSRAQELVIQLSGPFNKPDTIRLTTGSFYLPIRSVLDTAGNRIYRIPLQDLPDNSHFFFKPQDSDPCPSRLNIQQLDSLGTIGLNLGDEGDSISNLQFINVQTGLVTELSVSGISQEIQLPNGEYLLVGLDSEGNTKYMEPIGVPLSNVTTGTQGNQEPPTVEVFPKPCKPNGKIELQAYDLEDSECIIVLSDMNGRELSRTRMVPNNKTLQLTIQAPVAAGIYKVSLFQSDRSYSYLVPVKP